MKRDKGISLIVLIITIIVIIILAGSVILSLANNNPISQADEAVFRSDISNIQSEISIYATSEYARTTGTYDITTMTGKLSHYLTYLEEYDDEFIVVSGNLSYIGKDLAKMEIAKEMGLETSLIQVGELKYNKPEISYLPESTTKAIKWDENNNESEIALSQAKTDTSWYDYANKKWANIKTSNNINEAYWVWIPRYAYKITYYTDSAKTVVSSTKTNYGTIDVKFLAGTSNSSADGSILPSGYIVHPAFTFGNKELTGIWVAKYEASSSTPNAVDGNGYTGGGNNTSLQVRVLPDVYSWRSIYVGNAQTVSMNMTSIQGSVGTTTNLDSHQIKNNEWGAVAYLSQSAYGMEPWTNPFGDWVVGSYKFKTGYSGQSKDSSSLAEGNANLHLYNDLTYGINASTTGNIYGIYDMSGGAWEYTASYIDNGNSGLGSYGMATYFTNNILKTEYSKYYDTYEPSDEEKSGGTYYGAEGIKLWNSTSPYNVSEEVNNIIRKRLTDGTYANSANKKGDALYETSTINSYWGKYTSGTVSSIWLIDTVRASSNGRQYAIGWNNDYILTGCTSLPWFARGGGFDYGVGAGIFTSYSASGWYYVSGGFRPVLVSGVEL